MNKAQRWIAQKFLGMPDPSLAVAIKRENPVAHVTVANAGGGTEAGYPFDVDKLESVFQASPYAYAAVNAIARDVAATPMIAERMVGDKWERIDRPPDWFRVFEQPNPDDSIEQFLKDHVFNLYGAGNGYMALDPQTNRELYNIEASKVKAQIDKGKGIIGAYAVTANGQIKTIDAKLMIHTRLPRIIHSVYGTPPAALMKKTLSAHYYLTDLIDCYFKNGAQLGIILKYIGGELRPEERSQFREQFEQRHGVEGKKFKAAVLEGQWDITVPTTTMKDAVPKDAEEVLQLAILAMYGVPPNQIGNQEQKYANSSDQTQRYQRGTVEPVRRLLENALNSQLVWKQYDPSRKMRVRFDRTDVAGLEEDLTSKTNRASTAFRSGIVTRDEARTMIGLDPTGDDSGSEYGSGSPILGDPQPAAPRSSATSKTRLEKSDRERLWWAHSRRLDSHEITMKKAMATYFLDQGDRVLAAFDKITAGRTVVSALRASLLQRADVPGGDRTNEIFNKTAENNQLKKDIRPVIVRIMEQSAAAAQEEFSLNVAFDVTNPMVSKIVAAAENRIVKINDTTYDAIKRLLQNAIDDGESLDSVARRIRDLFDGFSKTRATVVARTETNGIMNGAADATYRMAGIEKKEWLATLDDVTRDSHAEADGQTVPMSSPFEVGGEALAFPGDQGGSPGNTINCRCAMAPVIE